MLDLYVYAVKIEGNDLAALSFVHPDVVGQSGLPAEAVIGEVDPRQPEMTVEGFRPNESFLAFLHELIAEHASDLPALQDQAKLVGNGPVYVMDYRSINKGEKPPFEDVVGWFGVADGRILIETYNANPNYKLLTNAGPFVLDERLESILVERVNRLFTSDSSSLSA